VTKESARTFPTRIISGGQTGVDRAALDVAIERGIEHGGWCPAGRRAEDGPINPRYQLQETGSDEYYVRTEQNVIDSDATLIFYRGELTGGTKLTFEFVRQHDRPHLLVNLERPMPTEDVRKWLDGQQVKTLNIAGPRESSSPGICTAAKRYLVELFN